MEIDKDYFNAEYLAEWMLSAKVDRYEGDNKQVFVATKGNEQLIMTCHWVKYSHGLCPHINIVLIKDGDSELLYQDIIDEKYGEIKHGTGNITGNNGIRENIETIWHAFNLTK